MNNDNQKEFRFYVKIIKNSTKSILDRKVVYYKTDMTFDFFMRWKWYF